MNTSLFSNMFKSLFGEQITPTAQQFVPITGSDGTPAGISSMANLNSVLGGLYFYGDYQGNIDNVTKHGMYKASNEGGATGLPNSGYNILIVIDANGWRVQLLFETLSSTGYFRATASSFSGVSWNRFAIQQ